MHQETSERVQPCPSSQQTSRFIDWYSEGQECTIEVNGTTVTVRFVGRKGRRARIAITAPAGGTFAVGADVIYRHVN